jgi:hypothetical protein
MGYKKHVGNIFTHFYLGNSSTARTRKVIIVPQTIPKKDSEDIEDPRYIQAMNPKDWKVSMNICVDLLI